MVTQFFQTLFAKTSPDPERSKSSMEPKRADWDAGYEQYVQPAQSIRESKRAGYGASMATRRGLIQMWMESLPPDIRPHRLADEYEQIAFTIALNWGEQRELKDYMQQVIFSSENAPRCFTPEAFKELVQLDRFIEALTKDYRSFDLLLEECDARPHSGPNR